jgi:oxygen-independent coproporphyrinogen-3 oxidase
VSARCLYIHIPFCIRKCVYCDFYSIPFDPGIESEYVNALGLECILRKEIAGELGSVFLGGGTPSILSRSSVSDIMNAVRDNFSIRPSSEITIETNPCTITNEKAASFLSSGINRISIGIQSFNDTELLLLGRIHNSEAAKSAFQTARSAGFHNISIDLIYGLPGQDMRSWERTLSVAIELTPEHISTYELTPEKDTPLYESLKSGSLSLPEEDVPSDMYYRTIDMLRASGYIHYEISNFAKPGYECLHNLNYWNRGEYLGIGAGAHSFYNGRRIENIADAEQYMGLLAGGVSPVSVETSVSETEALKEQIFLGIRKTAGFDISGIGGQEIKKAARALAADGLVELDCNVLRLSRNGLILCNEVILKLMEAI